MLDSYKIVGSTYKLYVLSLIFFFLILSELSIPQVHVLYIFISKWLAKPNIVLNVLLRQCLHSISLLLQRFLVRTNPMLHNDEFMLLSRRTIKSDVNMPVPSQLPDIYFFFFFFNTDHVFSSIQSPEK